MSTFRSITIQGTTYEFAHLTAMMITVAVGTDQAARSYTVLINFSCHCFTDAFDGATHTPDYRYHHDTEMRAFSHSRYDHSKKLPGIIGSIQNRRVYFTFQNNYVIIEETTEDGTVVPYTIFFDMKKGTKGVADVVMTISSAYVKENMTKKAATIRFHTLVAKIARGEKPMPGSPQGIRKRK